MCTRRSHAKRYCQDKKIADDLYIGGNTISELLQNWEHILQAFERNNLRLSSPKTIICPVSTTILGWNLNSGQIYCHATPLLKDLHWLPIKSRIQFKILLLVFKSIHGEGPAYLASMLEEYCPSRRLRSADQSRLVEPLTHKKYGERAFSVAGPKLWNALRDNVKKAETVCSFKSKLKTLLFQKAYNL